MIVADTCLVFHLFNETVLTLNAQQVLKKDPYWILPPLWKEEYANVLSKLARKEGRSFNDIIKNFNYASGELKDCEIFIDTNRALELSLRYKISVYDAHFIALAIDFDILLVTEDKEILKNCSDLAVNIDRFLENIKE